MDYEGMLFNEEDDMAGFLGVHIDRYQPNQIILTQSGIIERIADVFLLL